MSPGEMTQPTPAPVWIAGPTGSGRTGRLVQHFRAWVEAQFRQRRQPILPQAPGVLVLAANEETRRRLGDRLAASVRGRYPIVAKTPLGFCADEVELFWPLLFQRLHLRAQFPLRLHPETEQELAARLWHSHWQPDEIPNPASEARLVRSTLDLMQLAGASGTDLADIPTLLSEGLAGASGETARLPAAALQDDRQLWSRMSERLQAWRLWCLERGLLTYGSIYELYGRELLGDPTYRDRLQDRYRAIFADDLDDYPAIARNLFDILLDSGATGAFTFNPNGCVRLGLGADPDELLELRDRCAIETLELPVPTGEQLPPNALATNVVRLALDPFYTEPLPPSLRSLQTISRAALLRQTAEAIARAVDSQAVRPSDIAIIAPGLDDIARYTLIEILDGRQIPVKPLNEQRPLASSPLVRALLTMLCLVYPGSGRATERDAVAEMLVMLSRTEADAAIDPVRAGLLADHCFVPNPELPCLLAAEDAFPRWDRLGRRASHAYDRIRTWIDRTRATEDARPIPNAIAVLESAIQAFYGGGSSLPHARLAALRELMETAQHFWDVDRRLRLHDPSPQSPRAAIAQFVQLVRKGTISANPYPERALGTAEAVTLATIFQYRSSRRHHRWQFWLDVSSPLWLKGGAADLFGAPLFQRNWSGRALTAGDRLAADEARLERLLHDLLGRATERVYLCHSDLAASGAEQTGPLLTLMHAAEPLREANAAPSSL
ncbi:hypothetical protein KR51_00014980 [Rubidibacter lacunae KORDI 51-2]|uniref:Uncharacterized protein n=1 Tax=Rubidibacter lacunae KORDI 51-2 TaxID=582515 RepID=U5DQ62_9CHRO|nr:hypothetical protein [Rubidibacter lacunae]ERN41835.1 hypothetical protein KR51_00014980 [Rubidibacter lacunae KORDI 51-2]